MKTYFTGVTTPGGFDTQLFVTDGTDGSGTRQLTTGGGTLGAFPTGVTVAGAQTFFTAFDAAGKQSVYVTDGTASSRIDVAGTAVSYDSVSFLGAVTDADDSASAVFIGRTSVGGVTRYQLYGTDGTVAGTEKIGSSFASQPSGIVRSGRLIYFTAPGTKGGTEVWAATASSLVELDPSPASLSPSYTAPGVIVPVQIPDGTRGVAFVANANTGSGAAQYKVFFSNGAAGAGTVTGTGSFAAAPGTPIASGRSAFFTAVDGSGNQQVWSFNGVNPATRLDLPGATYNGVSALTSVPTTGGARVAFLAKTGTGAVPTYRVVVSDGTVTGTRAVGADSSSSSVSFYGSGDQLYFWRPGGDMFAVTATGATKLDPTLGTPTSDAYLSVGGVVGLTAADGSKALAFFGQLNDLGAKWQLYVTTGTAGSGTVAIGSPFDNAPVSVVAGGASLFFTAVVGGRTAVFRSSADDRTLTRLDPGGGNPSYTGASNLTAYTRPDGGQGVAFFADTTPSGTPGTRLFVSDGTAAGTAAVTTGGTNFSALRAAGTTLLFTETDGLGQTEAWSFDGTSSVKLDPTPQPNKDSYTDAALQSTPSFSLIPLGASKAEGQGGQTVLTFRLERQSSTGEVTIPWRVSGSGGSPADAADFVGGVLPTGNATFLPGESAKTISIAVAADSTVEPDETFTLSLTTGPDVPLFQVAARTSVGTILNDDTGKPPVPPGPVLAYQNETTKAGGLLNFAPADAGGPSYLQWQYIFGGTDTLAISTEAENVFIHGGNGTDAIQVKGGRNVLDGGLGSNFLTGGSGADTFFTDSRAPGVVWNTIRNFGAGDAATLWGFKAGISSYFWEDTAKGAPGSEGATLRANIVGGAGRTGDGIDASITFTGMSVAQAKQLHLVTGTQPAGDYLYIVA